MIPRSASRGTNGYLRRRAPGGAHRRHAIRHMPAAARRYAIEAACGERYTRVQ